MICLHDLEILILFCFDCLYLSTAATVWFWCLVHLPASSLLQAVLLCLDILYGIIDGSAVAGS